MAQRPLALLALFVAISLLTRWLSLVVDVLDMDETAHIVGAWDVARGWVPYRDTIDNKPPLVYAYFLLAQAIFGRGLIPVHAFTALVTVPLTALGVSAFVGRGRLGFLAGLTFLVYSAAFIGHDMLASNTEIPMMLPATWALVAVRDARQARCGRRVPSYRACSWVWRSCSSTRSPRGSPRSGWRSPGPHGATAAGVR